MNGSAETDHAAVRLLLPGKQRQAEERNRSRDETAFDLSTFRVPNAQRFHYQLTERQEVGLARRRAPPCQADRCGRAAGARKRSSFTRSSRTSTLTAMLRHQRDAVAVRHHLHDGREAGRAKADRRAGARRNRPAPGRAGSALPPAGSARCRCRTWMTRVLSGRGSLAGTARGTDRRTARSFDLALSTGSASITASSVPRVSSSSSAWVCVSRSSIRRFGIAPLQRGQHLRQDVGGERRDDAERQPAGEDVRGGVRIRPDRARRLARARPVAPSRARPRSARPRPAGALPARPRGAFRARGSAWTAPAGSPRTPRRPGRNAGARPAPSR